MQFQTFLNEKVKHARKELSAERLQEIRRSGEDVRRHVIHAGEQFTSFRAVFFLLYLDYKNT